MRVSIIGARRPPPKLGDIQARPLASRDRLPLFTDDDDTVPTKQEPSPCDADGDQPSEEVP